jgi:RecA-family ATPase
MIGIAAAANVFAGNENDRSQVQQFIALLTRIAMTANGSLNLISHPSLTGIATDSGLSGTTQWHNSVRSRIYVRKPEPPKSDEAQPDKDLREIVFMKNNYGREDENIRVRWQSGMFLPLDGAKTTPAEREATAREVFLDLLRRFTSENRNVGQNHGPSYAPKKFAEELEAQRAGLTKRNLEKAMRQLFQAGTILNEPYGRPSRYSYRVVIK